MPQHIIMLCIGFVLDILFGDPQFLWHPVQGIGKLIEQMERGLFFLFGIEQDREVDKRKKRLAGNILVIVVLAVSVGVTVLLLIFIKRICPELEFAVGCIICYQMLAMKSLRVESMKVYDSLQVGDMEKARYAVSMIVGRDTDDLTGEGIVKAAVETVAENTSDGVIAPLFYMLLFGPVGGVFYKAVNTMDSMVGYRNDRYCYFGTAAARLDDVLNFVPARLSAAAMMIAAFLTGMDVKNAWHMYKRDRYNHKSPNSAQTEAVCAGALNVQLAGPAYYFGELVDKPVIGDKGREIEAEDIKKANRLLYVSSVIVLVLGVLVNAGFFALR
ncbi:MAG: adenosylcobinamide-phosphate synthase CbiB [Lachnospiraceae bacterium]|nr:adenosylcobinamide-phosphate synthase CbiB [Lachnospiraceae bacterium]